jgi:hypothetical protein
MTMILLKANGTVERTEPETVTLEDVQKGVGGYIEGVPYFDVYEGEQCQAWCDEEGKIKSYPMNEDATKLWYQLLGVGGGDYLVGDIVILTGQHMLD